MTNEPSLTLVVDWYILPPHSCCPPALHCDVVRHLRPKRTTGSFYRLLCHWFDRLRRRPQLHHNADRSLPARCRWCRHYHSNSTHICGPRSIETKTKIHCHGVGRMGAWECYRPSCRWCVRPEVDLAMVLLAQFAHLRSGLTDGHLLCEPDTACNGPCHETQES